MLIPVYKHTNPGSCKTKGRKDAVIVGHAIVDDHMTCLAKHYWVLHTGYAVTSINGKRVFMHHMVLSKAKGFDISHENANKLDNRLSNLRYRTRSQNMLNTADGARLTNKSCGIRGVTRDDKSRPLAKLWRGKVAILGKVYQTRRYATPEEAATALDDLRRSLQIWEVPTC